MKKTAFTTALVALALLGVAAIPAHAACAAVTIDKAVDQRDQFADERNETAQSLSPTTGGSAPYIEYRDTEKPYQNCDPTA